MRALLTAMVVAVVDAWPRTGCFDNRGSFITDGQRFLDSYRNVERMCKVVDERSFTFEDIACQVPNTDTQLFANQLYVLEDVEYECKAYTAGGFPRLRLLRRELRSGNPVLYKRSDNELIQERETGGNREASYERSLPRSRFCFENGQLYAYGEEWTSEDGSLRLGCQRDGFGASVLVLHCLTPASAKIPLGKAIKENGRLYSCRAEANGEIWREEAPSRDLSAPCRRSRDELAQVQRQNQLILARNKHILESQTTAADAEEFNRLIFSGRPYDYQSTNYYRVLQSLEPTLPLPPLQCKDSNDVSVYMVGCEGRC